jgi:DNA-binding transcriptional LysR family regulator
MLDWDKLRIFHAVAQAGNITHAGETLGLSQSAVSRHITALEERLKQPLFHRRARGLILTEQGEMLYRTSNEMLKQLASTEQALREYGDRPRGRLRVTLPVAMGTFWLIPMIKDFREEYPEIELEIVADDKELDLSMREADLAIRFYPSKQPDLIQKPLLRFGHAIYAAHDYIQEHGMPTQLKDLQEHTIIGYTSGTTPPFEDVHWLAELAEKSSVTLTPKLSINSLYGMQRAVKQGIGIAALPDYMVANTKKIIHILPQVNGPTTHVYVVYSQDMKDSRRIRAFRHFIQRKILSVNFS